MKKEDIIKMEEEEHRQYHRRLIYTFIVIMLLLFGGATFYYFVEKWTYLDSVYFSTYTITTVGYGDIIPLSKINRFLAATESFLGMTINVALLGYVLSSSKLSSNHDK